jgi:methylmalonyl-CoA mutase N-terminal domain/subunit
MKKRSHPNKSAQKQLETSSGLSIEEYYAERLRDKRSIAREKPGKYPYTRGLHETMYRGKLWTMRQYAGFGSAQEANERYHYLLKRGSTGLSVAFDLPTQMGWDADNSRVAGEVGKVGVSICSIDDMERLFDQIPLDKVSVSMTINATAPILLAFYLVVAEARGISWRKLSGTIQNDILKEYIARGTYIYPPQHALRLVTDVFKFCAQKVPEWNTISISGYHMREAGCTASQEIGFTFANAIAYVEGALARGLPIDSFAPRLAFFFNCHNEFLEEVAKFRAARQLWATIMKERFKAKDPRSHMLRFHTQTAGSTLTAQQPMNNIVRTTIQAMAAVFGGTQSLHTNSFDEALGLPTEESATIALRTQQVIAHESGIAASADPLGGSYLIESWTERLVSEAQKILSAIESRGGMVKAIEDGYPQSEIEQAAYRYQQRLESAEQVIVGVNKFVESELRTIPVLRVARDIERQQIHRLVTFRKKRNAGELNKSMEALKRAARGEGALMPRIIEAARARATLGEISEVLRGVFGTYR